MAAKVGGYMGKFLAVVFTSIVAPLLVDLAVRDIHGEANKAASPAPTSPAKEEPQRSTSYYTPALTPSTTGWQAPPFPHLTDTIAPSAPPSDEVDCIIVHGVGRTPEEARTAPSALPCAGPSSLGLAPTPLPARVRFFANEWHATAVGLS